MCVRACLCMCARAHTHMQACTHTRRYVPSLMATHSRTHRLPSRIHVLKNGPAQFLVLRHRPLSQSFVKSRALLPAGHCLILGHKGKEDRPALGPGSAALCSGQRSAPWCVCVCGPPSELAGELGKRVPRLSTVCLVIWGQPASTGPPQFVWLYWKLVTFRISLGIARPLFSLPALG